MGAATASADPRVVLEEGVSGLATLPAAQRTEATMAAQARVASAVAVTAISARSQGHTQWAGEGLPVPSDVHSVSRWLVARCRFGSRAMLGRW